MAEKEPPKHQPSVIRAIVAAFDAGAWWLGFSVLFQGALKRWSKTPETIPWISKWDFYWAGGVAATMGIYDYFFRGARDTAPSPRMETIESLSREEQAKIAASLAEAAKSTHAERIIASRDAAAAHTGLAQ